MRKTQKSQAESFLVLLKEAHEEIRQAVEKKEYDLSMELLGQCQDGAIKLGEMIEGAEGEGFPTISLLESYCEQVYRIYEEIGKGENIDASRGFEILQVELEGIEDSVRNEIRIRKEAVFLPYKASMWDSLESIWQAANDDLDCDAYVIPIPYYDKGEDGSLKEMHYEGDRYPKEVPVLKYDDFDFEAHHPDMIFIHNPYDNANFVTSVHPFFYSKNLKKYTDCLVYVPYYATTGGMSEAQSLCPAYLYADYIVIQSEKYKMFFDPMIPEEKFLPFGSPKFDRVIRKCQNPPTPPESWKKKMEGRRVYFYNTSINGMLENTGSFLKKMRYVFECFKGREDVCLLWRPHPLMESTFASMRKEYAPVYGELKQKFIREDWGIFDDTTDIENTIALCDGYIGDAATSVTALFGVAGKPLFILNNYIHHEPGEEDWRGEIIRGFCINGQDEWMITQGNKLYHAPNHDYQYEYYCDLCECAGGNYYLRALEIDHKVYVCPANAQEILVVQDRKIQKRIELERHLERSGAFCDAWKVGKYLFLIPNQYPAVVRLDTSNDEVSYITGVNEVFVRNVDGQWRVGGSNVYGQYLMIASPDSNQLVAIDIHSLQIQYLTTGAKNQCGCAAMAVIDHTVWLLPYCGVTVTRWNPDTGEVREYAKVPDHFVCNDSIRGERCEKMPFSTAVPCDKEILLSPCLGNMFLLLNQETGAFREWKPPFEVLLEEKNGYFLLGTAGKFVGKTNIFGEQTYRYFCGRDRKIYAINPQTQEHREISIGFDKRELEMHAAGFDRESDWLLYCCREDAFHSLPNFLGQHLVGKVFDREEQIHAYQEIAANNDGTCGEKIYQFARSKS